MAELSVDIVARVKDVLMNLEKVQGGIQGITDAAVGAAGGADLFDKALKDLKKENIQTTAQLKAQAQKLIRLREIFQDDAIAVQQLDARLELLNARLGGVGGAANKLGRARGLNTQIWFQAGQAISDFAIAGVRGAANNIEFLAAQLGVGAPLLIGLSLASAAFFVFGDDIAKALDPIGTKAKEVEKALQDVIDVIENPTPDLLLFEDQIPAALEETRKKLLDLQDKVRGPDLSVLFGFGSVIAPAFGIGSAGKSQTILDGILGTDAEIEKLGRLEGAFRRLNTLSKELTAEREAEAEAGEISLVQQNLLRAETIRLDLELVGLKDKADKLSNTELLTLERKVGFEGIVAKLRKDEVSELEKAQKKLEDIRGELGRRRSGELSVLDQVRDQTRELQEQLRVVMRLNEERRRQAAIGPPQRAVVAPAGGIESMADIIRGINSRETGPQLQARGLSQSVLDQFADDKEASQKQIAALAGIASGADRSAEAFERARLSAEYFYTQTSDGLASLADASAQAAHGFSEAFLAAFEATGSRHKKFFVAYKALGIAEATIATYKAANEALKAGPIVGPILAAGVIAQGLANVARIASVSPGGGSGGSGGGTGTGLFSKYDVSRSNAERLGLEPIHEGLPRPTPYNPTRRQDAVVVVQGSFDLRGEDLHASVRTVDKRVSQTRDRAI